jgi:hypothetical protein
MTWEVWRQDDNGNRFMLGNFDSRELAQERLDELTRCLHKQTYWISEGKSAESSDT